MLTAARQIHRATEHLVDGVEYERDQDVRSEPELYSHTRSREQMQDDSDLMAMINVSEDILRTLRYVQDNNTNRQQQQEHQRRLLQGTNHRHHRGSSEHLSEPVSPRESIARGQKRKKEQEQQEQQQQQGVSHKQKVCIYEQHHIQPSWQLTYTHFSTVATCSAPARILSPVQVHRDRQMAVRARRTQDALQRLRLAIRQTAAAVSNALIFEG